MMSVRTAGAGAASAQFSDWIFTPYNTADWIFTLYNTAGWIFTLCNTADWIFTLYNTADLVHIHNTALKYQTKVSQN